MFKQTKKLSKNTTVSNTFFEMLIFFATELSLLVHYHKFECLVKEKWNAVFKVKVTTEVRRLNECSFNVCPDNNL